MPVAQLPKQIESPRATKPVKPAFARLLAIIAWQVAALLFVEFVLFVAGLGEEDIFKLDSELGTKHMTNKRVTWRTEGFAQSYLDGDGMREPGLTVAKPPGTYRVALLGDSMVEGLQVPIDDTFGRLVEKRLSTRVKRDVQVLNFGTSGYSTAQEYLQLKGQVLRYQPDLVLLCYDSRDMFENWSPADQVITNVRPVAVHLPGGELVVHSYHVKRWMKSPRARFLNGIEWVRRESRIWGLLQALDLDLSLHNPVYRAITNCINKPKQALKEIQALFASQTKSGPSFQIKFFEATAGKEAPAIKAAAKAQEAPPSAQAFNSAAPNAVLEKSPVHEAVAGLADARKLYVSLVERTMGSLLKAMRSESGARGARFAVMTLPVRSALCPEPGMETSFYDMDYGKEVEMMEAICKSEGIPMFDCQSRAKELTEEGRAGLFYSVHLKPEGHAFIADQIFEFLRSEIEADKPQGSPQ